MIKNRTSLLSKGGLLYRSITQQGAFFSSGQDQEEIDFGFKSVPRGTKESLVAQVFSNVASSYDVMNDLMSGGMHRHWKDSLVEKLRPFPGMQHLDVAGGTGDVAMRVLRAIRASELLQPQGPTPSSSRPAGSHTGASSTNSSGTGTGTSTSSSSRASSQPSQQQSHNSPASDSTHAQSGSQGSPAAGAGSSAASSSEAEAAAAAADGPEQTAASSGRVPHPKQQPSRGAVTVFDINAEMLQAGQKRVAGTDLAGDEGLSWVLGNAEHLPFPDQTFDSYTIAFGIRNVTNRDAALKEALRVLKKGGRFLCLEFSTVHTPFLRELYDVYSFNVIPKVGGLVANDEESYRYLVESIRKFPDQDTFADMIEDAGFKRVSYESIMGGIVAMHSGFKL
ncbi:MAG: hypothetical protein WDW38_008830 [Sanguina aurantia]